MIHLRPRRNVPIQVYLAALFAVITLVIGLSTAVLFYNRMKATSLNDAVITFHRISINITQQVLEAKLEIEYRLALAAGGRLASARSFSARLAAKDELFPLLNANSNVLAAYVGYPNGDSIFLWKTHDIDGPPSSLHGSAVYVVRSVERVAGRPFGRFWFYDKNRKLLAARNEPSYRFDPRTRPWWPARTDALFVSPLYVAVPTGDITLTFSQRSSAGSVFGVGVELKSASALLARLLPTPSGVAAVVSASSADVLAFSDPTKLVSINKTRTEPATLYDLQSPPLTAAFAAALRQPTKDVSGTYTDAHRRVWLYTVEEAKGSDGQVLLSPVDLGHKIVYRPLNVLVLAAPEDEILANATRVRNDALIVCGALLLSMFPITYWLSRFVSGPLRRLRSDALALRNLDFSERPESGSFITEVDEFAQTFGTMRTHIREYNEAVANFIPHQFLELLGHSELKTLKLGDHCEAVMSILFSDIRAFTTLSGMMRPDETFRFVNSYLTQIGPIIREQGGFIDKYIGDGIFALFPDRTSDAIDAAIAMQRRVVTYNEGRARAGYKPIAIGIGMHRGDLMLGTIGESQRYETTVISDAVNIAARMEGLTKAFGSLILASGAIVEDVERSRYCTRRLGEVLVKGATHPITVYEICDADPPELLAHKMRTQSEFERGRLAYARGDFPTAETLFREVAGGDSRDHSAAYYRDRSAVMALAVISSDWDGVEQMEAK